MNMILNLKRNNLSCDSTTLTMTDLSSMGKKGRSEEWFCSICALKACYYKCEVILIFKRVNLLAISDEEFDILA